MTDVTSLSLDVVDLRAPDLLDHDVVIALVINGSSNCSGSGAPYGL